MRQLIEQGAEYRVTGEGGVTTDITNHEGYTPLHLAIQNGHVHTVQYLLVLGVDIKRRSPHETTLLEFAQRHSYPDNGELTEAYNGNPQQAIIISTEYCYGEVIDSRIRDGESEYLASIMEENTGKTLLIRAAESQCNPIVESLMKALPSEYLNQADYEGNTALNAAIHTPSYPLNNIVQKLIEGGADVNKLNNKGISALFAACKKGFTKIVQLLLQAGADSRIKGDEGLTPLGIAIKMNRYNVVELLNDIPN